MSISLILAAAFCVSAVFTAYQVGQARGACKGRAKGWCDYHFQKIADDNARRDRAGRFTNKQKKAE